MNNIMIDLETLGTAPGSAILSVGAVEFSDTETGTEFYCVVDLPSCTEVGLNIDPRTVQWWMDQSDMARAVFREKGEPLAKVLGLLAGFFNWEGKHVWANGASFDLPILSAAYDAAKIPTPWAYYNERCYRTLKNLVPRVAYNARKIEPATAHHALDDARAQALNAIWMMQHLRGDERGQDLAKNCA